MKVFIFLITLFFVSPAFGCGLVPLKPLTPLGCSDLVAVCVCDENGQNCYYQWHCT